MSTKGFRISLIAAAIMAFTLQGCDDSNDNSSGNKVTASLVTPVVSNLAFKGSSGSSGRTNTAGEYQCEPGEEVTFSLGASAVGTVACSANAKTSLMQLAGGGLSVETALAEMQRADGTVEVLPYDQWINRLSLLAELDSHADLSDGVQLPDGLGELDYLKTGKLNFDQERSLFGTQTVQVFQQAALAGLYQRPMREKSQGAFIKELEVEALGALAFPGYAVVNYLKSEAGVNAEDAATFNNQGFLTQVAFSDNDANAGTRQFSHDAAGRVVKVVNQAADGSKTEEHVEWDTQSRITKVMIAEYDADGNKQSEGERSDIYNSDGFLSVREQSQHNLANQTLTENITFYTYSATGQLQSINTARSITVNGVEDDAQATNTTVTNSYDDKGNLVNQITDQRDNSGALFSRTTLTLELDDHGRVVQRLYQEQDANGNVLASNFTERTFSADGYPAGLERLYEVNGEAVGGYKDTYAYAGTPKRRLNGKVRKFYNPAYANGDQEVRVYSLAYQYNDAGLRTQVTEKTFEYQDGNGNALAAPRITTSKQSWSYDANNNPNLVETDTDGDGTVDKTETMTWQRLERFGGWHEINEKAKTFSVYDEEFKVFNESESGWEAGLRPVPPPQSALACIFFIFPCFGG
jgi:hypothetical protein